MYTARKYSPISSPGPPASMNGRTNKRFRRISFASARSGRSYSSIRVATCPKASRLTNAAPPDRRAACRRPVRWQPVRREAAAPLRAPGRSRDERAAPLPRPAPTAPPARPQRPERRSQEHIVQAHADQMQLADDDPLTRKRCGSPTRCDTVSLIWRSPKDLVPMLRNRNKGGCLRRLRPSVRARPVNPVPGVGSPGLDWASPTQRPGAHAALSHESGRSSGARCRPRHRMEVLSN